MRRGDRSGHATVDAAAVRRHFQALSAAGVPRAVLVAALGVDPARLDERDGRIPCQANLRLLEAGTAALGQGSGLRLGAQASPHELGACGFLFAASASLEEALAHFLRYQRLIHGLSRFSLTRTRAGAVLRHELSPAAGQALAPVIAELNLAAIVAVARRLAGQALQPTTVSFRHRRQAEPADYQRAFGRTVAVSFGRRDDALVWSAAQLAQRRVETRQARAKQLRRSHPDLAREVVPRSRVAPDRFRRDPEKLRQCPGRCADDRDRHTRSALLGPSRSMTAKSGAASDIAR